jgi:transcriptional regulator with XRE-family HTH domain
MVFSTSNPSDVKLDIGIWLRSMRKSRRLSQEELASALGLSRITLQNAESGKNITLDTLLLLLRHFEELENIHKFVLDRKDSTSSIPSLY